MRVGVLGNEYGVPGVSQDLIQPPLNLLVRRRVAELTRKLRQSAGIAKCRWPNPEPRIELSRTVSVRCNRIASSVRRCHRLR